MERAHAQEMNSREIERGIADCTFAVLECLGGGTELLNLVTHLLHLFCVGFDAALIF